MAFELQEWIKELELTDDQRKVLEPIVSQEKVQAKLKVKYEEGLRQEDYSRHMNTLGDKEKELEGRIAKKESDLDAHEKGLVEWKGTADKTLVQRQAELAKAQQELTSTRQAMDRIAADYSIDRAAYGITPTPVGGNGNPPATVQTDPPLDGKYVSLEQFKKAVSEVQLFPQVAAELQDLSAEHQQLFGKPLTKTRDLVADAVKRNLPIREVWEEVHKVAAKREEVTRVAQEQHDETIREEERTKVRSELRLPAPRPELPGSPVLGQLKPPGQTEQGPQSSRIAVDAAVAAWSAGKHRTAGG